MAQLENIAVAKIQIASNCKREEKVFDEGELKASIKADDLLQSVLVNKTKGKYELICGTRRFEIAKALGHKTVPAVVKENLSETDKDIYRLSENMHRAKLSDVEIGHRLINVYEAEGFAKILAKKYLEALNHQNYTNVPKNFSMLAKRIGINYVAQIRFIKIVTDLDPEILEIANRAGLNVLKKEMLVNSGILATKDKDIRQHVQKKLIDKLKGESTAMSRHRVNQEVHNLHGGKVYQKDESGKVFSNPYEVEEIDFGFSDEEKLNAQQDFEAREKKSASTAIFKLDNSMRELVEVLTGQKDHWFKEEYVKNTKDYRLELFGKFKKSDLLRAYNAMLTVKIAIDESLRLLDKEIDKKEKFEVAHEASKKILTK